MLALVLAACGARAEEIRTTMATGGRSFDLEAPGVFALRADFSATIERDGQRVELVSTATEEPAVLVSSNGAAPGGEAEITTTTLRFPDHGCALLFQFSRLPGVPGVAVQSGIRNTSSATLRLVSTSPVRMEGPQDGHADQRVFLETNMAAEIHSPLGIPQDNLSANMSQIRIAGETTARGIGCQSPSEMRFPLDGKFTRFQCLAGVDDTGSGSVTFEVHADGKKLYDSGQVLPGQPGRVIDLDVAGLRELKLVVTDAGDGSNFDLADWADARLTRVTGIDSVLPPADAPGIRLASPSANWLASPMTSQIGRNAVRALDRAFDPLSILEAGALYDTDARGLFFGPVGTPVTYLNCRIANAGNQRATLDLDCAMDSVEVLAGETRWGQQVMLSLERPQAAQDRWISWVAESHRARPPREPMSGWLSWYWLGTKVSESNLIEVADFAAQSGGMLRPGVIQIDDNYQRTDGQLGFNEKFPSGMQSVASKIAASGALPGLMLQPHGDDPENVRQFLEAIRHAVTNGFRYLKIANFVTPTGNKEKQTFFERKRAFYQAIREAAGEDAYLLAATYGTDRACVGAMDACRVRSSAERHKVGEGVDDVLRSLAFNQRWFTVDTDCYYLATDIDNLPPVTGGWPMLRTWLSVTGLTGGNAMTSDPWHWDTLKPYLRHTEILTPPARESARAVDLGLSAGLEHIVGRVNHPWGEWTVALLWNPGPLSKTITLDFAKAGMKPGVRYAVWSFWENRFLGIAEKSWTTEVLGPAMSQHFCFTPIEGDPVKPTLIGSNLHIWCGAAEFGRVTALHGAMEIVLSDAGARAGDLFVHCASRPVLRAASGCKVKDITGVGGNIWKISLEGRALGSMQQIDLGVYVPVTHQAWFWSLLILLAASLVFGSWRYVEKLRFAREVTQLKQKGALDEERARIARDLHDELGANIARIGLLTELAAQAVGDAAKTRHQIGRIFDAARGITRQLDSVVWAVDPAHDTLESLATYLHSHAEDYLGMAGIRCRFDGMDLPPVALPSSLRHHLLMITKEALHNVVKHSGAGMVSLRIQHDAGLLTLEIEDDGKGVSVPNDHRHGNGLNNIRKRAQAAAGTCEFLPGADGKGTLVRLIIPVPPGNIA